MYRITKTIFVLHNGKQEFDHCAVEVEDLEKYRESLKNRKYKEIHFVYEAADNN